MRYAHNTRFAASTPRIRPLDLALHAHHALDERTTSTLFAHRWSTHYCQFRNPASGPRARFRLRHPQKDHSKIIKAWLVLALALFSSQWTQHDTSNDDHLLDDGNDDDDDDDDDEESVYAHNKDSIDCSYG